MLTDVDAVVLSNSILSPAYNVLSLAAPQIASRALPGQFVMVKPDCGNDPLLRRPFSIFEVLRDDNHQISGISLLNKQVGVTTSTLFGLTAGDNVRCLGPLGRPFSMAKRSEKAWMVAGGVGLAPFYTLAVALQSQQIDSTLFYGGQSSRDLFYVEAFRQLRVNLELTTDDGSLGHHGQVTGPLERSLHELKPTTSLRIYACGPTPMMRAVTKLASAHGHDVEVSLEQIMGCGLGGCYSCVVPIRHEGGSVNFVRSCLDGPIFNGRDVVWDGLEQ
ncbi:MAG: dihydroorotate dehydrogenase electron transfer subunit [Acidobacteria bacterium]|nr:dihydroorotate dehydrogenase electron transfer subunit [Acidobacteriota bacterium]